MRKKIIILSIILLILTIGFISIFGQKAIIEKNISNIENINIKYDEKIINCKQKIDSDKLILEITSKKIGKTKITVTGEKINEDLTVEKYMYTGQI